MLVLIARYFSLLFLDFKVFFHWCCCCSLVARSSWSLEISFYQLLPCQVRTSTGLTGFKVGKMAFSDCLLCFSRKSNRTKTMVTLSQPTQLWEQANFRMHNYWGRGSRGFLCFPLHLQGCRVPRVGSLRFTECSIRLPSRSVLHSVFSNGTRAKN